MLDYSSFFLGLLVGFASTVVGGYFALKYTLRKLDEMGRVPNEQDR